MAGRKNLLSDTDYTRGHDNRFGAVALIGKVSKIECSEKGANVRVSLMDKLDHNGQPMITKPIPVWQISSGKKRSFAMPRINQNCVLVKLPTSTTDYLLLGTFYTRNDPPPVTDPRVDYCEWEGGHTEKFDSNDDADVFLTQDFKAGWKGTYKKDVQLKTTDSAKFNIEADGDVLVKSANGNITIQSPTGTVLIEQDTIDLQGSTEIKLTAPTIRLIGHVIIEGAMDQTGGVHTDPNGLHTSAAALLKRIEALEEEVAALKGRESYPENRIT
jgi:phage baseplate assembly protein gpV